MFEYSADEALGQSLDLIIPERFRARHWDGYRQVMATGVTSYGQRLLAVPAMRKDGQRISIEFSIALLKDEHGEVTGAAAIVRDVTARWQAERELRRRLAAQVEEELRNVERAILAGVVSETTAALVQDREVQRRSLKERLVGLEARCRTGPLRADAGTITAHVARLDDLLRRDVPRANAFFRTHVAPIT